MTLLLLLTACSSNDADNSAANEARTPLTESQFDELKSNCSLAGATFGPTARSETTIENGVESTVTYEAEEGSVSIFLDESQVAGALHCIDGELKRLGATAGLQVR
jgi:major membrane immunogen (membrane-anchored lipoprotein)